MTTATHQKNKFSGNKHAISDSLRQEKDTLIQLIQWHKKSLRKPGITYDSLIQLVRKAQTQDKINEYYKIVDGWMNL